MTLLTLGNVNFESFEVPERLSFGGSQKLSVHTLIGGARIIDAMGRDDAALKWSGILSGPAASSRARTLDVMRASGHVQTLTWDVFAYSVIIQRLSLEFCSPWWIPYTLDCEVQRDLAQGVKLYSPTTVSTLTSDLTTAASLVPPALAMDLTGASESLATMTGVSPLQTATTLSSARDTLNQMINFSGSQLKLNDLATLTSAAGSVAQLCCARSYISRSISNANGLIN